MTDRLCGVALAGGQSRRMGHDKAFLSPKTGQPAFVYRAWELLQAIFPVCIVSCAPGRAIPGLPCVEDPVPGLGPACGILAGLEKAAECGFSGIMSLACDMPLFSKELALNLVNASGSHPSPVTLYIDKETGRLEMLAAIYSLKALPKIRTALQSGQRSLRRMFQPCDLQAIPYAQEQKKYFLNCNTPQDMETLANLDCLR